MTTSRKDRDVLTIDEVAEMHRVAARTVRRWIAGGNLAASKLPGGLVRIDRADAEALLSRVAAPSGDRGQRGEPAA